MPRGRRWRGSPPTARGSSRRPPHRTDNGWHSSPATPAGASRSGCRSCPPRRPPPPGSSPTTPTSRPLGSAGPPTAPRWSTRPTADSGGCLRRAVRPRASRSPRGWRSGDPGGRPPPHASPSPACGRRRTASPTWSSRPTPPGSRSSRSGSSG